MTTIAIIFFVTGFLGGTGITLALLRRRMNRVSADTWKSAYTYYSRLP